MPFVVRTDHDPRRIFRRGLLEHVLGSFDVLVPFLSVAPIVGTDLPVLLRIGFALFESLELLVFCDREKELHEAHPTVDERALEIVAAHLDRLGPEGKTVALVYDTGAAGGQYAICVWLISAKGIVAAETVSLASYTSFARGIETSLGVATRAAVRAPRASD